jgi:hypothetical protein
VAPHPAITAATATRGGSGATSGANGGSRKPATPDGTAGLSSAGFGVDQTFLTLTSVYILVPSLMVVVSLLARARMNRITNIFVSLLYAASIVVTVVGETWVYYILGSAVEVVLLLTIARVAWTWRRPA